MSKGMSAILEKGINIKINLSASKIFDEYCSLVNFSKGATVLLQGDMSYSMYFIIAGVVRGYYIDEKGYDITKCFSCENDFFSTEGFRTNEESSFNIECLEDCRCIQIPYEVLNMAMQEDGNIIKVFSSYALKVMELLEKRARDLVIASAEERYRSFLDQFPSLNKRINQKYIASYIGVRESSLSRIKKLEKLT